MAPSMSPSTATAIQATSAKAKVLRNIPSEILHEIVLHHLDPVDQVCLALTSHFYYNFILSATDKPTLGGKNGILQFEPQFYDLTEYGWQKTRLWSCRPARCADWKVRGGNRVSVLVPCTASASLTPGRLLRNHLQPRQERRASILLTRTDSNLKSLITNTRYSHVTRA